MCRDSPGTHNRSPPPMPYASALDMTTRFGEVEMIQVTDHSPDADAVDTAVMERALLDADAEINARLQARYTLPLATVPRLLLNVACDIARYRLFDDRATEQVRRRYDDALKLLDKIGRGELSLGLDAAAQATPSPAGPSFTGGDRVFSRAHLSDYAG